MAILKVARLGNPVLRTQTEPLDIDEIQNTTTQTLIDDMIDTMRDYGGLGLAAPQVHVPKNIVLFEPHITPRYPEATGFPLTIMINPRITVNDNNMIYPWESCLSIPDLKGMVPRYKRITVDYLDREGNNKTLEASDFLSVIIQHEVDHLNGKVFLDRMENFSTLSYLSEFMKEKQQDDKSSAS